MTPATLERLDPRIGDYLTDGSSLLHVESVSGFGADRLVTLEDCATLDMLVLRAGDLAERQMRLVRTAQR